LLLTLVQQSLSYDYRWAGNETLENEDEYSFRNSSLVAIDLNDYWALFYSSLLNPDTNTTNTTNTTRGSNAIFGCVYVNEEVPVVPTSYVAFYDNPSLWNGSSSPVNANVSGAVAFLGFTYQMIFEIDWNSSGFVQIINLSQLEWSLPEVHEDDDTDEERKGITRAMFTGHFPENSGKDKNFSVRLIPIVSNVIGVLNSGTILTPQTLEVIVEIDDFPYTHPNNSVMLSFTVAQSTRGPLNQTTIDLKNGTRWIYGENSNNSVYYDISNVSFYGNRSGSAEVGIIPSAGLQSLNNNMLINQFASLINSNISVQTFTILFNPNESNISYDPAQGIGNGPIPKNVPSVQPSVVTYALTLAFVLGGIFVLILMAIFLKFYCEKQKREEEKPILELEDQE